MTDVLERPGLGLDWVIHELPDIALRAVRHHRTARVVVTVCTGLFLVMALLAVRAEGFLLNLDTVLQDGAIGVRRGWLDTTMVMLTALGTRWVIGVLAAGLVLWALVTRRCRMAVLVIAAAVLLNPVFEVAFKELVGRARPDLFRLLPGNGPSFPSGHVLATVGFYGMIPLLVWEATTSFWARRGAFFGSLAVIVTVAASRVYLDVHWTTDVVAGLLLGTVLVAITYHALEGHALHLRRSCCTQPASA